jgi:hypothetical protein
MTVSILVAMTVHVEYCLVYTVKPVGIEERQLTENRQLNRMVSVGGVQKRWESQGLK